MDNKKRKYLCPFCKRMVLSDLFALNADFICEKCFSKLPSPLLKCIISLAEKGVPISIKESIIRKSIESGLLFELKKVPYDYVFEEDEEYFGELPYLLGGRTEKSVFVVKWNLLEENHNGSDKM